MNVTDWNKWCETHHVKIKGGEQRDSRSDADRNRTGISDPKVEAPRRRNA